MFAVLIPIPMVLVPFLVAIGLFVWVAEKVGDSKRKNERRRATGQIRQPEKRKSEDGDW